MRCGCRQCLEISSDVHSITLIIPAGLIPRIPRGNSMMSLHPSALSVARCQHDVKTPPRRAPSLSICFRNTFRGAGGYVFQRKNVFHGTR